MARASHVGTILLSNTALNATHDITLPAAFATAGAPNYMRFWTLGRADTSDAIGALYADLSHGIAASASARGCVASAHGEATANSQIDSTQRDDCIAVLVTHGTAPTTTNGRVDINSVSNTTVQLINDEALGHTIVLAYEIITFDETFFYSVQEPASATTFSVTGCPFTPDYGEILTVGRQAFNSVGAFAAYSHGVFNASESAVVAYKSQDGAASSNTSRYMRTGEVIACLAGSSDTGVFRATFTSFNSDGVTFTASEREGTRLLIGILTRGGSSKIESFAQGSSNGATTARTGYGFQPRTAMVWGVAATALHSADVATQHARISIGAASDDDGNGTPDTQIAQWLNDTDAAPTMQVQAAIYYGDAYVTGTYASTVGNVGGIQSFDSDGLTWVATTSTTADVLVVRSILPPDLGALTLTVADATHGHTVDNVALTQQNILAANDALHSQTVDNVALTQQHILAMQDALHGHTAESPSLVQQNILAVADALHAHTADNVALTFIVTLAPDDALHGHTADNVVLSVTIQLVVQDALHGHTVDNVDLTQQHILAVADALHAHFADSPTLVQSALLTVADALHALTSEEVILALGSETLAWAFTLDGHIFYVLNDVDGLTLICDLRTGQWHHWYSGGGMAQWNMYRGHMWQGRALAADIVSGEIWEVDANSVLDEGSNQIKRVVTAFQPVRGKQSIRQGSLRVTASVGEPSQVGATVVLRFSDDEGQSWSSAHARVLTAGDFDQQLRYRSLGRLREPGRIWEITDQGGLVTIEGADADMEGQ